MTDTKWLSEDERKRAEFLASTPKQNTFEQVWLERLAAEREKVAELVEALQFSDTRIRRLREAFVRRGQVVVALQAELAKLREAS